MKRFAVALPLILASLALVACGGSSDSSSSESSSEAAPPAKSGGGEGGEAEGGTVGTASSVQFEADPGGNLEFTTDHATAKAGKVTVDLTNTSGIPHDVAIEDSSGETLGQTQEIPEGTDSTVVDLKPGTYTFYCTVPGHREAGMEGTLTVK
jgi:plastocyanin